MSIYLTFCGFHVPYVNYAAVSAWIYFFFSWAQRNSCDFCRDIVIILVSVALNRWILYRYFLITLESIEPDIVMGIPDHKVSLQKWTNMRGVNLCSSQIKLSFMNNYLRSLNALLLILKIITIFKYKKKSTSFLHCYQSWNFRFVGHQTSSQFIDIWCIVIRMHIVSMTIVHWFTSQALSTCADSRWSISFCGLIVKGLIEWSILSPQRAPFMIPHEVKYSFLIFECVVVKSRLLFFKLFEDGVVFSQL